jgi:hypothetical protein
MINNDELTLGVGEPGQPAPLLEVLMAPESELLNPIGEDRNPLFMAAVVRAEEP